MQTLFLNSVFFLGLLAMMAYGFHLYRKNIHVPIPERIGYATIPSALWVIVGFIAEDMLEAAWQPWNNIRLLPAFMLAHGSPLYYPPNSGPVLDMMYGPFSTIAYWPVALLTSSSVSASVIGKLFTLVYFFGPVFWLTARRHTGRPPALFWAIYSLVGFWFYSLESNVLGGCALSNHADAPALAFSMLACIFYLEGESNKSSLLFWLSAFCISFAIWTKQVTVPLALALPIYVGLTKGWREALLYAGRVLTSGVLLAVFLFHHFGYATLVFNLITNPAHQPWEEALIKAQGHGAMELWTESRWIILGIITYLVYEFIFLNEPPKNIRDWFNQNRWSLFLIVGTSMIPTSLVGRFKVGGALNSLVFSIYFLSISFLLIVIKILTQPVSSPESRLIQRTAKLGLCFLVISSTILHLPMVGYYFLHVDKEIHDWDTTPSKSAVNYLQEHPDEAYLPWNVLSTYLATGQLYHFDYALYDRDIAGFPITPEHFRAYLPPKMKIVAFPPGVQDEYVMRYLPEFSKQITVPELPGWKVYTRA